MAKKFCLALGVFALTACASRNTREPASVSRARILAQMESAKPIDDKPGFFVPKSQASPFVKLKLPVAGPPRIYGAYSSGCIGGADYLPKSGQGYEVQRLSRNRFYGHPSLIELIKRGGRELSPKMTLFVGDLGMPAGGPAVGGHASHQTGLDVDMWFLDFPKNKVFKDPMRERLSATKLVDRSWKKLNKRAWRDKFGEQVMWFAGQPEVSRIFVNAVIKKKLCQTYKDDPRLVKVRPWGFHHEHYHVRLNCPADQPGCESQPPPTAIECEDTHLAYWWSKEKLQQLLHPEEKPPEDIKLPVECRSLFDEPRLANNQH